MRGLVAFCNFRFKPLFFLLGRGTPRIDKSLLEALKMRFITFYSFPKKTILLNQKKVCFSLHIKKDFSTRTLLYITAKKIFLFFCLFINNFVYICNE